VSGLLTTTLIRWDCAVTRRLSGRRHPPHQLLMETAHPEGDHAEHDAVHDGVDADQIHYGEQTNIGPYEHRDAEEHGHDTANGQQPRVRHLLMIGNRRDDLDEAGRDEPQRDQKEQDYRG